LDLINVFLWSTSPPTINQTPKEAKRINGEDREDKKTLSNLFVIINQNLICSEVPDE